jgi:hypothetical protein
MAAGIAAAISAGGSPQTFRAGDGFSLWTGATALGAFGWAAQACAAVAFAAVLASLIGGGRGTEPRPSGRPRPRARVL